MPARLTEPVRNKLFQGILDNVNAAIHVKDADGRYLLVNREFERIRCMTAEEILGRNEDEIGSAELANTSQGRRQAVIESGAAMSFEQELRTPDGDRTFLSVKFPVQERGWRGDRHRRLLNRHHRPEARAGPRRSRRRG